jgi:small subunit ribosomal protein S1
MGSGVMPSDPPEESFAALFEQTGKGAPPRRGPRPGDTVDVVVVQVGKDAVFVELDGRRQGFIEATDLRAPDGSLKASVGEKLRARVVSVDADGIRVAPTVEAAAAAGAAVPVGPEGDPGALRIAVGQVVSGAVERVETYGVFLQIDGTKGRAGRGLIPTAELGVARGADLRKHFPLGTKLKAKVLELAEGKMRLSVRALRDDEERAQFEGFKGKDVSPPRLGTLGDLLKARKAK